MMLLQSQMYSQLNLSSIFHLKLMNQANLSLKLVFVFTYLNLKAPMIKKEDSSTKLISIRRQQRSQQLEQIRNSLRFTNECQLYQRITEDRDTEDDQLTDERLQKLLKQQDLKGLYQVITTQTFEGLDLLERYGVEIVDFLKSHLASPIGVISLGNMVNNFEVCGQAVIASNCFEELVSCLGKLTPGSQGQDPYLWTLCQLTDRPVNISKQQLMSLLSILEQIFKQNVVSESPENTFLIHLIKNLSEINQALNQGLTIYFANCFWTSKNQGNKLNIYLTCCNLITRAIFHRSTKVLVHLLAVCLRGKQHLELQRLHINIDQVLLSPYALLKSALQYYNEEWECMQSECHFQIQGNTMRLGLHTFLLTLQHHIFLQAVKQPHYYDCLFQFCRHAPIQLTIKKWLQFGTIQTLIRALTQSSGRCCQVLKIFQILGHRIADEQSERSRLFQMLKSSSNILQRVGQAIYLFGQKEIMEIGERVLIIFDNQ